jgi:hypothetical protein
MATRTIMLGGHMLLCMGMHVGAYWCLHTHFTTCPGLGPEMRLKLLEHIEAQQMFGDVALVLFWF